MADGFAFIESKTDSLGNDKQLQRHPRLLLMAVKDVKRWEMLLSVKSLRARLQNAGTLC